MTRGARGWRQKWKRVPPGRRGVAAASLRDVLRPRRVRGLLPAALCASLLLHGATLPFLVFAKTAGMEQLQAREDSYLQRVLQKERARKVSREVKSRLTMPPAPPEPEAVVQGALSASLAGDVEKITAGLLDVKLQSELTSFVKASLKDELAAAAKDIAEGRLTEEEIKQLHRRFQRKAHDKAIVWRKDYLIKHQEERAAMSTTEWYESQVRPTLFRNMAYELFGPGGQWPPSALVWQRAYTGVYGWGRWPNWSNVNSHRMLQRKVQALDGLVSGRWHNAGGRGKHQHPAWPGPNAAQAEAIAPALKEVYSGSYTQTYPRPSWRDVIYGSKARPRMTLGILEEFHPHRLDQMRPHAERLDELWTKALAASEAYLAKAGEPAATPAELKKARSACMDPIGQIVRTAKSLMVARPADYQTVNWSVRLDILTGPGRDRMYDFWVEALVKGLSPLLRDFARGQFKKGIIVHTGGVEQAMKEFPRTIVPMIRRDVQGMLSRRRFHDRITDTVYPPTGYRSKVTGKSRLPNRKDAESELAAAGKIVAKWPPPERDYADKRRELLERDFHNAVNAVKEGILEMVFTGNLLYKKMDVFVEGVDYADKVQEKLDARAMALAGRGQDLARLTAEGVPDTSAPLVALMFGASKGHGANLQPVPTVLRPGYVSGDSSLRLALRTVPPSWCKPPAPWDFEEQASVKCKFRTPRFEGIPFLSKFPRLDGDLRDWGRIRPLILRPPTGPLGPEAILVYAAWNYQGFFFGYHVRQEPEAFYWPSLYRVAFSLHSYVLGAGMAKNVGTSWAYRGDYLQLLFDTLDARSRTRGDPHTQEFVIFPQGTENSPDLPGIERVVRSKRDGTVKDYRRVKDSCKVFPQQPPPDHGPDGTGPYRVTRPAADGYTTEVFLPRSLFGTPVFCPGWHIGFHCAVATGYQGRRFKGECWGAPDNSVANRPHAWGDLLLLGTDPLVIVQEASASWPRAHSIVPGHSYLITVMDPDRNVHPTAADNVLVSAEVIRRPDAGSAGGDTPEGDVEVFILSETGENTGVFRGCVDTQPGPGRQVQGVLEVMPLEQVRLGYVDVGSSEGKRNVIHQLKLPVVAGVLSCLRE